MIDLEEEELTPEERVRQEQVAIAAELRRSVGVRCELRNHDNNLVFIGRVKQFDGISLTIVSETGRDLPPVIFNTQFKLLIRMPGRSAMVWKGSVCGSTPQLWKVDHLVRFHYSEHRSHFRQPSNIPAQVIAIENPTVLAEGAPQPCRLLDISLGGLQLRSPQRFERGAWLLITEAVLVARANQRFSFTGQVCWADRVSPTEFLYGLRFAPMSIREQDRLCSAIFSLQRIDLQAHLE